MMEQSSQNRRPAAQVFIFITVALDMIALGIIAPIFAPLVASFKGGSIAGAALILGYFGVAWALMQFVASPVLGVVSDRFGRRPVVLVSNFGTALDYAIMALAPGLGWLFVGRLLSGITAASIPTASAYIADITPEEKRAGAYGMIGAAFGLGFVVGPAIGGFLGAINLRLPFWVAGGLSLANAMYGLFVLPESLKADRRKARFEWSRANPLGSLRLLRSHPELFAIASVAFIGYLAHEIYPTVFVLYGQYRYAWTSQALGIALAIVGITSAVVMMALSQVAVSRLGARRALLLGLFLGGAGFVIFGYATKGWIFWIGIVINAFWGIAGSAQQVFMTRRVRHDEQGELQGALASLRGIAMIAAPLPFAWIFANFIRGGTTGRELPGAPWYSAATLVFVSMFVAWRVLAREPDVREGTGRRDCARPEHLFSADGNVNPCQPLEKVPTITTQFAYERS